MLMQRSVRSVAWVCCLAVVAAGWCAEPPQKDDAVKKELQLLEGEWEIVAVELGKESGTSDGIVKFSGTKCTISTQKVELENTITLDPSKTPKEMTVTNTKTKEVWPGIYEIKGNTMKAVFGKNKDAKRPSEFKTQEGSGEVMYTYKRVQK